MLLKYVGPHDAVEITAADGSYAHVARGGSADVPDATVAARVAAGFTTGNAKEDIDLTGDAVALLEHPGNKLVDASGNPEVDGPALVAALVAERQGLIDAFPNPKNAKKGDI